MNSFLETLPQIYAHLWSKTIRQLDPIEKTATCDNCICSQNKFKSLPHYKPDLKCCTFHPFMPNYLVGELLSSPVVTAEIKQILRTKIMQNEYALPLGVFAPIPYQVAFINREPEDFGNRRDQLCPYFNKQQNNCGVWQHRGAVCTSYFCMSDQGEAGMQFWEALGDYLHGIEMSLSQDFIASRGFSPELIEAQLEYINCEAGSEKELASNSMDPGLFKYIWADYQVQEIESFYISASQHVRSLSSSQFSEILDNSLIEMEETLIHLYKTAGFKLRK